MLFVTKFVERGNLCKWLWRIPTQVDGRLDDAVVERNDEEVAQALVGAALTHEHDDAAGDERVDEQLHLGALGNPLERRESHVRSSRERRLNIRSSWKHKRRILVYINNIVLPLPYMRNGFFTLPKSDW